MGYYRVQLERREDMIGIASVVAVYDNNDNDVTLQIEQMAVSQKLDLHGAHLHGETEEDLKAHVTSFISSIVGVPANQLDVDIE